MRLKFGKSSKRSSASAASQDKDINPLSLSAAPESIHEDCIEASTVTSALTYSPTSKTKSTKFEASSPSTTTSIMTPKSTCHQSSSDKVEDRKKNLKKRFSRKIKKKKNPKGQDVDGERVVMGDEYAIVTVQPKGFPPHYRSDDANNNTHDSSILWQSARTTTPTSTSSHPNPQPQQRNQEATGSNNSNNNLAQSNELKKQRFSMVRMLSARRSPRHERKDNQVEVEEPVLSVEDTNEGYELPRSTSMPQKKKKISFRRSKSIKQ